MPLKIPTVGRVYRRTVDALPSNQTLLLLSAQLSAPPYIVLLSIVTQLTTESVAAVVQRPGFSALKSESENVNFTLENASEAYGQFAALIFVKDIFLCENKC